MNRLTYTVPPLNSDCQRPLVIHRVELPPVLSYEVTRPPLSGYNPVYSPGEQPDDPVTEREQLLLKKRQT
ncbi:hypothetical protein AMECASPLE_022883 [Ameca splendens]|uniref:Uncharacterized protein n=1 Tax=Ameca splendens TaxID=208324 RepID=A0ABV0YS22_9TELE